MGKFFFLVALYAFVAGGVAIKRRGLPPLHINSRKAGVVVVAAGFVAMFISAGLAAPAPEEVTTAQISAGPETVPEDPAPSPSPSAPAAPPTPSSPPPTVAAPAPAPTQAAPAPAAPPSPPKAVAPKAAAPPPPPPAEPSSNCHASYEGECIPADVSDADCAGGSGDGPYYVKTTVKVVGPDEFDLDRDNDGWGCE